LVQLVNRFLELEGSSDGAWQQHQESCNSECDLEKPVAITSTSWKPESSSIPANLVMRSSSTRIPKDVFPAGFKLNTSMPMQHKSSERRSSKGIWSRAISDQRRTFSAEGIWFRPKIAASRYRSRNLGVGGLSQLHQELTPNLSGARQVSHTHKSDGYNDFEP
jgi:hypothetical protein